MKKLLFGAISLFLFAISIAVVEISCQKTVAQANTTTPGSHFMLYHTGRNDSIIYTFPIDDTSAHDKKMVVYYPKATYYISDINGGNEKIIPVNIPSGMSSGDYAKLTDDGTVLVFSLYSQEAPKTYNDYPPRVYSIYSCNVDGTNLKQIKEAFSLDDVH